MQINRQRGKRHQRKTAEKIKGLNLGTLGGIDVLTDRFAIECKSRMRFVVEGWYEQALRNSKGKIPLVVVHIYNKSYDNDYVILKIKDFISLVGGSDACLK